MGKDKKCYCCMMDVDWHAKVCPKCESKLGHRLSTGIADKPGFPFVKVLFVFLALGIAAKLAGYSPSLNAATDKSKAAPAGVSSAVESPRDAAIKKIKEKGAKELSVVGIADVGYKDDTLCVYIDQRFDNLSKAQQEQLLGIVAEEWLKAIGKDSTAVKLIEHGTNKTIAELVV